MYIKASLYQNIPYIYSSVDGDDTDKIHQGVSIDEEFP